MKKLSALVALLGAPSVLAAQATTVSSFVAADAGVAGSPVLLGAAVGRESRYLGVRLGVGVDAASTLSGADHTGPGDRVAGLVASDVDALLLIPGGGGGALPVRPYLLGGVGMRMVRDDAAGSATEATWSYGFGARAEVAGPMGLEAEARRRTPLAASRPDALTEAGWEVRAGVHLRFGRGERPRAPVSAPAPRPWPAPAAAPARPALETGTAARLRVAARALDAADDFLGVRYTWGGNTPAEGFDCSGFVRYVFRHQGIELPRVSRDQARAGTPLPLDPAAFQPGDLIAFASDGRTVDHIAIYAGDGRIIHSSSSGRGVRWDDLLGARGGWYLRHMVAARRVIDEPVLMLAQ